MVVSQALPRLFAILAGGAAVSIAHAAEPGDGSQALSR